MDADTGAATQRRLVAEGPTAATTLPRNLYDSRARKWKTDPLLPALVERLGLVHAIPVAAKVATVSVVEVAVLVAEVATVTASLIVLQWDREGEDQQGAGPDFRLNRTFPTHLAGVSSVSSTIHLASASSVHVPPMPRTAPVHVPPSGSHVTAPHGAAPRRAAQDGHVATVEVSTSGVASSDVEWRQEVARWAGETTVRARTCRTSLSKAFFCVTPRVR